ncbi:MAG: ATP-dependent Clp protease adaptor ClpS [Spirochaetaceae bacterium]|nr:ATP-dependent Clp protease adaptor ClpS [Spirochaetaceae bacterium]
MAEQATPPAPDLADRPGSDEEVREPPRYEVLMHNDHYTTMDFVVSVLESIFYKPPSEATRIMLAIHRHGAGRCGVSAALVVHASVPDTREVAEMKVEQVHRLARKNEFPLRCSIQEAP